MKQKNRIYLLYAAVLTGVIFSTFGKAVSIDRRGLVHAMGIDRDSEGYRVTVQVFKPSGAGSDTAVDISQTNISTVTGRGSTVSEAAAQCRAVSGKELFYGHLQLICLGRDIDLTDPEELFAFALGDKNISPTAQICLAKDKASDIMEAELSTEETSAEALLSTLEVSEEYSRTVKCTLRDMLFAEKRGCTAMPVLEMQKAPSVSGEKQKDDKVESVGTAIIKDGAVQDNIISPEDGTAAALLCGKAEKAAITTEYDGKIISCSLEDCKITQRASIENGRLHIMFDMTVTARPELDITPEKNDPMAEQISDELTDRCRLMLEETLGNGEDIFGIIQAIKHRYPKVWLRYRHDPEALLKAVTNDVHVTVKVG